MNILKTNAYESIIKFLRKVMGYSFNKFMNIDTTNDAFNERMSTYISDSGKVDLSKLEEFNSYLNKIKGNQPMNIKDVEKVDRIIENISVHYIEEKALNLEYYSKSNLDINKIGNDIEEIFVLANEARLSNPESQPVFMRKIYLKCLKKILINSHLRLTENVENLSKQLYDPKITATKKDDSFTIVDQRKDGAVRLKKKEFQHILDKNSKDVATKLVKLRLIPNKKFIEGGVLNVPEFISQVSIIANATQMKQSEIEKSITDYLIKNKSNKADSNLVEKLTKANWHKIYSINEFGRQAVRDNLYNAFYKLAENVYIYHSDGGFHFFEVNRAGKIFIEILTEDKELPAKFRKEKTNYYCLKLKEKSTNIQLSEDTLEDSVDVYINGNKLKRLSKISSFEGIINDIFIDSLLNEYDNRKYYKSVGFMPKKGGVDDRERYMTYDKLVEDLRDIINVVPKSSQKEFLIKFVDSKVSRCFGTGKNDLTNVIYKQIEENISFAVIEGKNLTDREEHFLNLSDSKLNQMRLNRLQRTINFD